MTTGAFGGHTYPLVQAGVRNDRLVPIRIIQIIKRREEGRI
jgi:hypothetical protein